MVLTNYLWEIPYNLIGLSRGFHCSITQLIPIKKIFVVLMISLCSILTGFIIRKLNLPPFLVFLIGGFFFFSIYGLLGIYFIPEMQNIFYLLLNKMNIQLKRI
jgi:ribose/xylose/arabinose/galactoside ABC-type transport system permease subunit